MIAINQFTTIRRLRCGLASLALLGTSAVMAQTLFREDFQTYVDVGGEIRDRCHTSPGGAGTYPFPSGWLLRNVDNRTPDAQVAYVNEAWEVREDFAENVLNCVAFSTSWYTPPGVANDWMWTPRIDIPAGATELSWRAKTYDPAYQDGYEVRVMVAPSIPTGGTGVIGNQISNSTTLFSTAAEQSSWITRTVPMNAYAGQGVYIGFRNNSNDKFLLVIDEITVTRVLQHDPVLLSLQDASTEYARVPAFLAYPAAPVAQVRNGGLNALTQVQIAGEMVVDGDGVAAMASAPVSLAPGAIADVPLNTLAYDIVGAWSLSATVTSAEGDEDPGNSALTQALLEVTDSELTRAEGANVGTLGIGAGNGGEIGQAFDIPAPAAVQGLRVAINNVDLLPDGAPDGIGDFNGMMMQATLRAWDELADEPGDIVATSGFVVSADAPLGEVVLDFPLPDVALSAGRYLAAVVEPSPQILTLVQTEKRYTPGTLWITWPTSPFGGWAAIEEFGTSFLRAAKISMLLHPIRYVVGGSTQGLAGTGLSLQINGDASLPIAGNGSFAFPPIDDGSAYAVTVLTQPTGPSQACVVDNGTGVVDGADVTDVMVTCTTNQYTVGGAVAGLAGSGLTLQLNGGGDLPISANGAFAFPPINDGSAYEVTVSMQPSDPTQTCEVSGGSGTLGGSDVTDVAVTCTTSQYTIGGTVAGLTGSGLMLQLNGGGDLPIGANGDFAFPPIDDGSAYEVTVSMQPSGPAQICTVEHGSGTLAGADVTDVAVACADDDDVIFADGFESQQAVNKRVRR